MDGLVYLLNQAGLALAQANQQIDALTKELQDLKTGEKGKDVA